MCCYAFAPFVRWLSLGTRLQLHWSPWHGFLYTEERSGFALRTVRGSNFSLGSLSRTDIQRTFEIDEERKR